MYHHGPTCLGGPVSRSRLWWQCADPEPSPERTSPDGMRLDLIARVRREIAAGTYETPERWEAALGRLLEELEQS